MLLTIAQGFWFVHPAIAGAAALGSAIPIAIHLLHRWNHRRVRWAAMRFLLAARQQSKRRLWLHNYLLLLLRIGLIVLLGFAVARPYVPSSAHLGIGSTRGHHILVLDNSLSMSAHINDSSTRFDRAKASIGNLLASIPKNDAVSLVSVAQPDISPPTYASFNRRATEEKLAAIQPTQRPANWPSVWSQINKILDNSPAATGNVSVHVLSDFNQSQWLPVGSAKNKTLDHGVSSAVAGARKLADRLSQQQHQLMLIGMGDTESDNVAVTKLHLASSVISQTLPMQLLVEITNFGEALITSAHLTVSIDNMSMYEQTVPSIKPDQSVTVFVLLAALSPGSHLAEASLQTSDTDALTVDNSRFLSIDVPQAVKILLVDGKPGRSTLTGEAGFLAAALSPESMSSRSTYDLPKNPASPVTSAYNPRVITPSSLDREALENYGAVMLCNVSSLGEYQWHQLESAVAAGVGLAVFAGDRLDPDQYNTLAYADGKGLLPGRLSASIGRGSVTDKPLYFQRDKPAHEVIRELASLAASGLFQATVDRYLPIELASDSAETILRYTNGRPAVVGGTFGAGRVLFCSTSANMSWTNLPSKGDFVSFVLHLAAYITTPTDRHRNLLVGEAIIEPIRAAQTSLNTHANDPYGHEIATSLETMSEQFVLSAGSPEEAGPWTLFVGADHYAFAVNVDNQESDLRTTSAADLQSYFDTPGVTILDYSDEIDAQLLNVKSTELVVATTGLVLGLLLVEAWLAMRLGPSRAAQQPMAFERHTR